MKINESNSPPDVLEQQQDHILLFLSCKLLSCGHKQVRFFTMNVSQTMETEEDLLTCLQIKLYHPQQTCKGFYGRLPLGTRRRHTADDPLRLGRDTEACAYVLLDPRVSRKQLAFYAYHIPQSSEMLFTIQNLSQRGKLSVNTSALGYLERMDLPDKALIRFGEYEILIIRESGEAKANFEVEFEVLAAPPSRETPMSTDSNMMNNFSAELSVRNPLESDEMNYPY
ncbi:TRAF-interacting protein with FHA domain-containing protein A isoform X1 [Oreochromis niloticus]|nr:TRAF-interacting protein with FHA domain-containing protein A isoform X1 [Oreochromis niloticus]